MKNRAIAFSVVSFALFTSLSCTTVQQSQPNVRGPLDDPRRAAAENAVNLICNYSPEWQYNRRSHEDAPPEVGLALSGGGMRAGSYSIGILKGLHELGLLEHVDVISAVSGGAYAAGWYITQKVRFGDNDDELFRDCDPGPSCRGYQHHLATHGRIINPFRLTIGLIGDVLMLPVNLAVNGAFGWHANTTAHRRLYEKALVGEFFTEPETHSRLRYSFPDLRDPALKKDLPLLIINMTAAIDDDASHQGADPRNTIYEMSPVRFGSDAYGYLSEKYPMDLPQAVAVSGAAMDLAVLAAGTVQKMLLSAVNLDIGFYVDNQQKGIERKVVSDCVSFTRKKDLRLSTRKWTFRAVPFPIYPFFSYWHKDSKGLRSYLSDGGHSENSGAFSLIRRLARTIIVADASGDPKFEFTDYLRLKKEVLDRLSTRLEVPEIDEALKYEKAEDRERIVSAKPVMVGRVSYFPYPSESTSRRDLKLIWIKLSYDQEHEAERYKAFPNVIDYRADHHSDNFPFQGLFDQTYAPRQYYAYRDLAYVTVMSEKAKFSRE